MPVNTDPSALAKAAACYCYNDEQSKQVTIYLLAQLAGNHMTPAQLAKAASCYCYNRTTHNAIITYLLNLLQQDGAGPECAALSGSGDPTGVTTPTFIGQLYHDTDADAYYRSTGLTNADWTAIGGTGSCGWVWGPDQSIYDYIDIDSDINVQTISFPTLVSLSGSFGSLYCYSCPSLTDLSLPLLASVSGTFDCSSCTSLTDLSLPLLASVSGAFNCSSCTSLTTVDVSSWIPTDGTTIRCDNCALTASSVELILARCVAAGVTTCTINLSGGTNAGLASLSAQGQADAATLGTQLTINN